MRLSRGLIILVHVRHTIYAMEPLFSHVPQDVCIKQQQSNRHIIK